MIVRQGTPVQTENGTASQTWTGNFPTIVEGALLLACPGSNNAGSLNSISGWNQIGSTQSDTDSVAAVLWRQATAADVSAGSWTFTNLWTDNEQGAITIWSYTGQDGAPIDVSAQDTGFVLASANIIGPQITSTVDGAMIVHVVSCDPGSSGYSGTSANGSEYFDGQDSPDRQWCYIHDFLQTTAGDAALEVDIAQQDTYHRWQFAIAPASTVAGSPLEGPLRGPL
jgi:hypothetical protein